MGPGPRHPAVGRGPEETYLTHPVPSRGPRRDTGDKHLALISPRILRVNGGPGNILVMLEKSLDLSF